MSTNANLDRARAVKNDEYYTLMEDIEKELSHYTDYFNGKVVYCNCDSKESNFVKYFVRMFDNLHLRKLIASCYVSGGRGKLYELSSSDSFIERERELDGDGSFDSDECISIAKQCDIIVTNPPFSIARERFIPFLMMVEKPFIFIGDINMLTYRDVFPLFMNGKIATGYNNIYRFIRPDGTFAKFGNKCWFQNVIERDVSALKLINKPLCEYMHYDGKDIIAAEKVCMIPNNYDGMIGVPITFCQKWNKQQFDIMGIDLQFNDGHRFKLNGKELYARVVIKRHT